MKTIHGLAVILVSLGVASAATAAALNLTPTEKMTLTQGIMLQKPKVQNLSGFEPKVGNILPNNISLHGLPGGFKTEVPAAKDWNYVMLPNNEILLVNPKDRRIQDIVMAGSAARGSAPVTTGVGPTVTTPGNRPATGNAGAGSPR